jgi:hypothetical protein
MVLRVVVYGVNPRRDIIKTNMMKVTKAIVITKRTRTKNQKTLCVWFYDVERRTL